jgi:hypothetical protein
MAMAHRLCQEIAQFLADHDGRADDRMVTGVARARVAVSLAEGIDGEVGGPNDHAIAADDLGRLAAFLDHGLPQPERNAMVATLAHDGMRRAEARSAVAFLNDIEDACAPLPAQLVARAIETFGHQASAERQQTVGQGQWSRPWPSRRVLLSSFAVLALAAVLTPAALSLIRDEHQGSVQDDGPIGRSLAPPPAANKRMPLDGAIGEPAVRSCESTTKTAQGDQPAGDASSPSPNATELVGGELAKPQGPTAAQSSGASADNPCWPQPSAENGRAPIGPPARPRD